MGTTPITGTTSGLDEEFCWQLAAAGHDLILVARREKLLNAFADRLHQIANVKVEVIVADLSKLEDCERVTARIDQEIAPVGLLVNGTGLGLSKPFPDNDLVAELGELDVMVRVIMVLGHHAARAIRVRGRGAILDVAPVASRTRAGTYSAHKVWAMAFAEGLSKELRGTGVTVAVVCPRPVKIAPFENAGSMYPMRLRR